MKNKLLFLGMFVLVIGSFVATSFAAMSDVNIVKEVHEGVTIGCTACHPEGNMRELNIYGKAFNDAGRNVEAVKAIDGLDSDGDGVTNADEIKAGTNPGDATSK